MSSISFPAFERAQQEHMGFERTPDELYKLVENAIRASSRNSTGTDTNLHATDASLAGRAAPTSQLSLVNDLSESTEAPKPKITKRVNARLQLAAALIEADNERIIGKAQFWHMYHPPQADDPVKPPPPPQPALASQSAIFAPYREGASVVVKRHVRTWSAGTGLSRILGPEEDDGRRPSVDFLGVALPMERTRSRAGSSVAGRIGTEAARSRSNSVLSHAATSILGRTSKLGSRPGSALDGATDRDEASDADALSEWGLDKFLTKEEREKINTGRRSRAQSVAESAGGRSSFEQLDLTARRSLDAARVATGPAPQAPKARSEIIGAATGATAGDPKLELLARIKLYRERQENLPPSEWDGPGPTATKDEVVKHIIDSSESNKRVLLRQASKELSESSVPPLKDVADQNDSTKAASTTGSVLDRPRPSRANSVASSGFFTEASTRNVGNAGLPAPANGPAQDALSAHHPKISASGSDFFGVATGPTPYNQGQVDTATRPQAIPITLATSSAMSGQEMPTETREANMVGVGSFSRSQSRRNSFLGGPLFNPDGLGTSPSTGMQHPILNPTFASQIPMSAAPAPAPGPGPSPLGQVRRPSRGWATDQFAEHDLGLGPSPFAAALQAASPGFNNHSELPNNEPGSIASAAPAINFNSLSTRQLQNVARNSTFPSHLGINRDLLAEKEIEEADRHLDENEFGQMPKRKRPLSYDLTALAQDLAKTGGQNFEIRLGGAAAPDLSSANWGKPRKKWFRLSMMADAKGRPQKSKKPADGDEGDGESDAEILERADQTTAEAQLADGLGDELSNLYAAEPPAHMAAEAAPEDREGSDGVDDDYISPPRRGPLRPRGLAARTPKTILMPQPLQGTEFAPKLRLTDEMPAFMDDPPAAERHSLHVPDGFVLHNRGGLPPMRGIIVHSANGPRPMFAAKPGKKQEQVPVRLKAVEVDRTVQVPAAAPQGIGRRAAAPTTALFRNHLVQNDDEREGWGWEAGTRVNDLFNPNVADSDDDDKPLADLKKKGRRSKRAAKRLAKEKRKRKAARRIRRAQREEAIKEGKSFAEVGVDELSPDEDLDLSSTSTEESVASETESEDWTSADDDDKRWIDDNKPAGKLYGKSLLDIAAQRNTERKSKARFYGQVQLEDNEATMQQVDGDDDEAASRRLGASSIFDDGVSVAPSMARSFRDKPIGYNDTRERMEAVFGADQVWAREMAKRQEEEAREAEDAKKRAEAEGAAQQQLEADAKAKKDRNLFTIGKKNKKKRETALGISNPSAVNSTASFASSNVEASSVMPSEQALRNQDEKGEAEPLRSLNPVEPPVIALDLDDADQDACEGQHGRKTPTLLAGETEAAQAWLIASDVGSEKCNEGNDSSDDDIPLSQVKKNVASRPVSLAAGLLINPNKSRDDDSSDEELPLAALKEKRIRQSMLLGGGKLDLNFSCESQSPARNGGSVVQSASPLSVPADGNAYDGVQPPLADAVYRAQAQDNDDSDEDLPLGQRHPGGDAALLAMRSALENQKRAEREAKQAAKAQKRAAKLARQVDTDVKDTDEGAIRANGDVENVDDESDDDDDDGDDSEDDKPLGYAHPQAAIIAEQAALIRQLQQEKEQQQQQQHLQQNRMGGVSPSGSGILSPSNMDVRSSMMFNRMSGLPNMGLMSGMPNMGVADTRHSMMGLPTNGSMRTGLPQLDGLPASSSGLPFITGMSTPMQMGMPMAMVGGAPMAPGSQVGMSGAMSPAMSLPAMTGTPQMAAPMAANPMAMMLDPKASSIHNWRTQVPADAPATITPPGGTSAVNSAH
ncbi:uncharacterized protein MEPE_02625 [Melanopsichium pennsylvanicum]|uniref:Uncharacterized protein n=2 Tax=Melanopsichium pennsylvanicum TaxID=63383 RepID=A0AAJ4XKE4_9BASI|nr:putative protein [Melanopsichium pennsylvanicum 4]SNX83917.1 uncharacterized protein MEPE_02625 [Melanopsichium pennsylvanicum]